MVRRTRALESLAIYALVFALVLSGCERTLARKLNPGGGKDSNEGATDGDGDSGGGAEDDGHFPYDGAGGGGHYDDGMMGMGMEDDFHGHGNDYDGYADFNVSARLEIIFPLMDVDGDGSVSQEELKLWHEQQGLNSSKR